MSCWYTRVELTRRIAWFYMGSSLASMFGGLIGYAVLKDLDGAAGIAGWVSDFEFAHWAWTNTNGSVGSSSSKAWPPSLSLSQRL